MGHFLAFLRKVTVAVAIDENAKITTAHFVDQKLGRMSWIIYPNSLPWAGEYDYLE